MVCCSGVNPREEGAKDFRNLRLIPYTDKSFGTPLPWSHSVFSKPSRAIPTTPVNPAAVAPVASTVPRISCDTPAVEVATVPCLCHSKYLL
jgi:hypothetical protein